MNGTSRNSPWTTALMALGWLTIAASAAGGLITGEKLVDFFGHLAPGDWVAIVATGLAVGGAGLACGMVLIAIARSGRVGSRVSRLALWARLCVIIGLEFCVGVPLAFYGLVFLRLAIMHDPETDPLDPLDGAGLYSVGLISGIPALLGLATIAAAIIWGRRKPLQSIPDVFS